jgi:FKBP-type peptidyl-prolyl cis-trans isomerase
MKRLPHRLVLLSLGLVLVAGCGDGPYTTTDSGLQYRDEQEGTGPVANKGDRVEVHYTGWLRNGAQFDTSRDKNYPFAFILGRREVIAGWDEGVQGMKQGGKRKLLIPSKLAYGEKGSPTMHGQPQAIPPNSDLTFEVELVCVYQLKPGGLYVGDLAVGQGAAAKKGDTAEIFYSGWVGNGVKYASKTEGTPVAIEVGALNQAPGEGPQEHTGIKRGIEGMKEGGRRKLIIPSDLAFGKEGLPPHVSPGAEITLEIELVRVKK